MYAIFVDTVCKLFFFDSICRFAADKSIFAAVCQFTAGVFTINQLILKILDRYCNVMADSLSQKLSSCKVSSKFNHNFLKQSTNKRTTRGENKMFVESNNTDTCIG